MLKINVFVPLNKFFSYHLVKKLLIYLAQSVGAVEYTDCTSTEG